jgi:predicted NUDIX family NTP pyrophosphohydrolase
MAAQRGGGLSQSVGREGVGPRGMAKTSREFVEETGFRAEGPFIPLTPLRQPSAKMIHAWTFEGDADPARLRSNVFSLEWPPKSGRRQEFPEADT